MSRSRSASLDRELLETAAAWRLRISGEEREPDLEVSEAFNRWLAASPAHAEAYDRTETAWGLLEPHAAAPQLIRARRDALDYARRTSETFWGMTPTRRSSFRIVASIAAAAILGAVAWPMLDGKDVYRTHQGERRQVTLADGSRVALDSDTRLIVRYTEGERLLTLDRGQARFDVAHNPYRPFSVKARDRKVIATGTAFNIDILGPTVQVTLIEGSVVVRPASPAPNTPRQAVALRAGQQLAVRTGSSVATVQAVKPEAATSWERGKLMFDDVSLAEAAMRVNRYSERQVAIPDRQVADLKVSGVFQTGDADAFARAMAQYLELQATFSDDSVVLGWPTSH